MARRVAPQKPNRRPWSERPAELGLDDFVNSVPPPGTDLDVTIDLQGDADVFLRGGAARAPSRADTSWLEELPTASSPIAWLNLAPPEVAAEEARTRERFSLSRAKGWLVERRSALSARFGTLSRKQARWLVGLSICALAAAVTCDFGPLLLDQVKHASSGATAGSSALVGVARADDRPTVAETPTAGATTLTAALPAPEPTSREAPTAAVTAPVHPRSPTSRAATPEPTGAPTDLQKRTSAPTPRPARDLPAAAPRAEAVAPAVDRPRAAPPPPPAALPDVDTAPEFDRSAAMDALRTTGDRARACAAPAGSSIRVSVTFARTGAVADAHVDGTTAGTPLGECIAAKFRGVRIPRFRGSSMTVYKTVIF